MVFTVYVDLVCEHSGRNHLFQATFTRCIQRNFLLESYHQFRIAFLVVDEERIKEKLYFDDFCSGVDHLGPLGRFLSNGDAWNNA